MASQWCAVAELEFNGIAHRYISGTNATGKKFKAQAVYNKE
jgi:hypothetical protein